MRSAQQAAVNTRSTEKVLYLQGRVRSFLTFHL